MTNPPWVKQFNPQPPLGTPQAPRPASPRGFYHFGAPESLLRIHFPDDNNENTYAYPWYWYYPLQQPQLFSFLGGVWGPGWVRQPTVPVIKILAADTQPIVPIPQVGFGSVEAAAAAGNPASFGRINFNPPQFWMLATEQAIQSNGRVTDRPKFGNKKGLLVNQNRGIATTSFQQQIENAVERWRDRWNSLASAYNSLAASVSPVNGFQYPGQANAYPIHLPDGPPTSISAFSAQLALFANQANPEGRYMGPVPGTAFFNINTITTQGYAFTIAVGQLDDNDWDMSVFPPRRASGSLTIRPSAISGDYNGFSSTPVPYSGPILI